MLEVALLIFAIAFAVMVGVFIPIGVKLYKTVDVVTSNKKAMEFLDEKSQNAIYKTSNNVMAQEKYQKKVAKYASQDLEKLLNLKSDDKISVKINVSDLKFENIDPKE